eukprot:4313490-Prymnesium_polylepis.1
MAQGRFKTRDGQGVVRGWSGDGQGSGVKSECSPQISQRAVDLQGLADRGRALVADLVHIEAVSTRKRAHGH